MTSTHTQKKQTMFWWIWISWLEVDEKKVFLYGCAAATTRNQKWNTKSETESIEGAILITEQGVLDKSSMEELSKTFDLNILNFTAHFPNVPKASIISEHSFTANLLGHSGCKARAFCTFPNLEVLGDSQLMEVLETLERNLNFPFKSSYANHLGNFELLELQPWLDGPFPFLIQLAKPEEHPGYKMYIERDADFAKEKHIVSVSCSANHDVLFDHLVYLEPGQLQTDLFVSSQAIDNYDLKIFDARTCMMIHREAHHLIREIRINMAIQNHTTEVRDKLYQRVKNSSSTLTQRATEVPASSSHPSIIQFPDKDPFRTFAKYIDARVKAPDQVQEDFWLQPKLEAELEVIDRINLLLSDPDISEGVVVDPYFEHAALWRIMTRIKRLDLKLTVLTSLLESELADVRELGDGNKGTFSQLLERLRPFINPSFRLVNLLDGQEKAFHDRYLFLKHKRGLKVIYILSNSLNNSAARWPFCMSRLSAATTQQVANYIEGLLDGKDITSATTPIVTFAWST